MFCLKTVVLLFSIVTMSSAEIRLTHSVFDYELYESFIDTEQCQLDLRRRSTFPFYDASFRVPTGFLRGNLYHLGNYHQCLNIKQSFEDDGDVVGKFCMINIPLDESIIITEWSDWNSTWTSERIKQYRSMRTAMATEVGRISRDEEETASAQLSLAVCIPRSCSVNQALSPYFNFSLIRLNYEEQFCRLPNDKPFSAAIYVAVVLFSIIGFLTLLSTGYDLYQTFVLKKNPKEVSKYLTCASVYTNTTRLFSFSSTPDALNCLDGIRSLSILWVIMGHTILAYHLYYTSNGLDMIEWMQSKESLWGKSANISVDTFLFLSGLLLVYTNTKKAKPMILLKNLHLFYLHRLLRMFPLLGAAVLLQASVFHHVADGVNWHLVAEQVQKCRQYWWSVLLYVQNLVNPIEICLPHTWYLSVDMQLHILAPLILFWVLGSRRTAWSALAISLLAIHVASTTYCFIKNFIPSHWSNMEDTDRFTEYVLYYYNNTLTRAPVFVVGMLFGYILHVTREGKVKMSWWFVIISYTVSLLLMTHCIFFNDYVGQPDWDNQTVNNLINSFMRTTWGISLGWIVFACVKGYGGPINWFLSWHMWKFIARISYAMYIFHYPYQFMRAGTLIRPIDFDIGDIWITHASDIMMTIIISVAACVIIDAPFSTLQKLLLAGGSKPKPNKQTEADKNEASTSSKDIIDTGNNGVTLTKDNAHI